MLECGYLVLDSSSLNLESLIEYLQVEVAFRLSALTTYLLLAFTNKLY